MSLPQAPFVDIPRTARCLDQVAAAVAHATESNQDPRTSDGQWTPPATLVNPERARSVGPVESEITAPGAPYGA